MSSNMARQSRKRKFAETTSNPSEANFVRRQWQNEVSSGSGRPPLPRTSTFLKVKKRSFRRRLYIRAPTTVQSTSRSIADNSQLASVSCNSDRKKSFRKSIAKLPKLFSRLLRLDSKSDKARTSPDNCPSENKSTESKPAKSEPHRWTTFILRLAGNRIASAPHSQTPASFVSFESSNFQADVVQSSKRSQLSKKVLPEKECAFNFDRKEVSGIATKSRKSDQAIQTSHLIGATPETLPSSILPKVVGNMEDDFALVLYPKQELFSIAVRSRNSTKLAIEKRHYESTLYSSDIMPGSRKRIDHNYQQEIQSSSRKSSQTESSSIISSDPFGNIPTISAPVLKPIRVKHSSWRKIQRKFSKKFLRRQNPEQREISSIDQEVDGDSKNFSESSLASKLGQPASSTSLSNESCPFGDVPSISFPVLEPVRAEVAAPLTSSVTDFPQKNLQIKDINSSPTQSTNPNEASSEDVNKPDKSISQSSQIVIRSNNQPRISVSPSGEGPLVFVPVLEPIQVEISTTMPPMQKFSNNRLDNTREIITPGSFNQSEPQNTSSNDHNVSEFKCHTESAPQIKQNYPIQASSSHTPAFSASTQIMKSVQKEKVITPVSLSTRSPQQIPKVITSGSSSTSSESNIDVKICPESAPVELSHFQRTHSSLSANSSNAVPSVSLPVLKRVGQVFSSTSSESSRSLREKQVQKVVPESPSATELILDSSFSSPHTLGSSTSLETEQKKLPYPTTKNSNIITQPGHSCKIIKESAKEASNSVSVRRRGSLQFGNTSSSFSSSSTTFQNSTETINSTSCHKKTSISLTNLLLAGSITSESAGSDAGNSTDHRETNAEGQIEFVAAGSTAHNEEDMDSDNTNTSREKSSFVFQKSIKMKSRKTPGR